ncbi:MAG TPA: GNAT family N-acetyltransferase [Thermoplasmata archaeon]|jgi:ribosomal protein S18 acetylase RimI-like enzyme
MPTVRVQPLADLRVEDIRRVVTGYISPARYAVETRETRDRVVFTLTRVALEHPFVKEFPIPEDDLRHYPEIVRTGWSLGAYDGETLVGLILAERREWNNSLWVWEIGVADSHRRRGVGRRLVEELSRRAKEAGVRILVCETQTTNVPAIDFYRRTGFRLEGIDLSYYTNRDVETGEIALFMKRRLD